MLDLDFRATLGWLSDYLGISMHRSEPAKRPPPKRHVAPEEAEPEFDEIDFGELAKRFFVEMHCDRRDGLEKRLNVPPQTLVRLRVGYSEEHQATTWPMIDSGGKCVGL